MNEYFVTLQDGARQWTQTVEAATAARARDALDGRNTEIISVKFVRALGFSCRIRGTAR